MKRAIWVGVLVLFALLLVLVARGPVSSVAQPARDATSVVDVNHDSGLQIARGVVPRLSPLNKFGSNADVDTAVEDIWSGGGTWVAPTQPRRHQIVSTSASDDGNPAGVGARTIRIFGLTSWDTPEVSEDITLNGTTNVPTVNTYVIIHRMQVLTKGATSVNVGAITATADTDGTVTARIEIGQGQTEMLIYGVPSTHTLYVHSFMFTLNAGTGGTSFIDFQLRLNLEPDVELTSFLSKGRFGATSTGTSNPYFPLKMPGIVPGPAIVKVTALSSANNSDVSVQMNAVLELN